MGGNWISEDLQRLLQNRFYSDWIEVVKQMYFDDVDSAMSFSEYINQLDLGVNFQTIPETLNSDYVLYHCEITDDRKFFVARLRYGF